MVTGCYNSPVSVSKAPTSPHRVAAVNADAEGSSGLSETICFLKVIRNIFSRNWD